MSDRSSPDIEQFIRCPMCGAKEVGPDDGPGNNYGCDECDYVASPERFGASLQPVTPTAGGPVGARPEFIRHRSKIASLSNLERDHGGDAVAGGVQAARAREPSGDAEFHTLIAKTINERDELRAAAARASKEDWAIFEQAMKILEDVPGETLLERIAKLKDYHLQLQQMLGNAQPSPRPVPCPQEAYDHCVWPRCDCTIPSTEGNTP